MLCCRFCWAQRSVKSVAAPHRCLPNAAQGCLLPLRGLHSLVPPALQGWPLLQTSALLAAQLLQGWLPLQS